jgi:NADPH:quinone reductase-like Zn-dependent oxidoreductase
LRRARRVVPAASEVFRNVNTAAALEAREFAAVATQEHVTFVGSVREPAAVQRIDRDRAGDFHPRSATMATMKAVRMREFGGPEVLVVESIDVPQPADDEVLVRVYAASVNPVDYKIRSGKYPAVKKEQLPIVPGRDVSGIVERRGGSASHPREGEAVYAALGGRPGGYAEYVALKVQACAPKPTQLDHPRAAAVPLAGLTAWQGLFDHGKLQPGQYVLIHGGAGGVGHLAIQFAKARGAKVSTTVSAEDVDFVRSLGADLAIDYKSERFEDKVRDVDLVFDLVGGDTQERSWAVLRDGGALISTLQKPSETKARERHARAENYRAEANGGQLTEIGGLIDEGKVRPHVHATFPLAQAARAQQFLEQEHVQGKIVLVVTT